MNSYRPVTIGLIMALLLACLGSAAWADRGGRADNRRAESRHVDKDYTLDARHRHNQYYPRHGHVVKSLPRGTHTVVHHRTRYYYDGGIWYRPSGVYFSVVAPPIGVVVPVLPPSYATVWVGSVPYYYAGGAYYAWYPEYRGYMVTEPPDEGRIFEEPPVPDQLFVYPKLGQDEEQQATDRYECHRWAVDQSGFDPTQPGGNVPDNENAARRADYNRATKACLEARSYSVQ